MNGSDELSAPLRPSQSRLFTIAKGIAFATTLTLVAILAARLAIQPWPSALVIVPGILLGYLAADVLSGTIHWFCDTFFSESTPLIGRRLILPFRDHHVHPEAITEFGLLQQDGSNYVMLVPILLLATVGGGPRPGSELSMIGYGALLGFSAGTMCTNLFHKWAHAESVPPGVRWLQKCGLILSPEMHRIHHTRYTDGYCVTSGWMNAILDRVKFFSRLERAIRAVGPRGHRNGLNSASSAHSP